MKKYTTISLLISILLVGSAIAQTKIYPHLMNPKNHPDYNRYHVRPPTAELFGNKTAFIALRSISKKDFKASMDQYIEKDKLGNVIWPSYGFLFRKDLEAVVDEIAKRNYYLFDIWGYVPGSVGTETGDWRQFKIPEGVLDMFEKKLGDRWLGMDNGEQDGRYVAAFSSRQHDYGADKFHQYLNFQNHFQQLCDELGNKMATLVSLNFGHYFIKEGLYTMIGAETAQLLPNSQIYYSFIRGACKQYGVPWFGNASAFNRWGWKTYTKSNSKKAGATKGTSLSLHKRLIYNHIMYNCLAVGFELGLYDNNGKLSPLGEILQTAHKWSNDNGYVGAMQTPIAVMTDFYSGWTFPRHAYSGKVFKVWGNLSYQDGDYLMDNVFRQLYPSYQDCSYFKNERGYITPTPYGDSVDALFSDAPVWVLQQYPLLVIANEIQPSAEVNDNLNAYVNNGGKLVITAGSLKNMKNGIAGVKVGSSVKTLNKAVVFEDKNIAEDTKFDLCELILPENANVIAKVDNIPAAVSVKSGKGEVIVIASPFGFGEKGEIKNLEDYTKHYTPRKNIGKDGEVGRTLPTPYPMLKYVSAILDKEYRNCMLFETNPELSMVVCAKNNNEYTVLISNDKWEAKPFEIKSKIGEIAEIKELVVPITEVGKIGHTPEIISPENLGKNTATTIAGGDLRVFSVKIKNSTTIAIDEVKPKKNPVGRALTLRDTLDIKTEILARPTFFQHFDRVVVDWKYFERKSKSALKTESGWLKRNKLKIAVDFSSGINRFPDLRIIEDDKPRYEESMKRIKSVIEKASILGVDEVIIAPHGPSIVSNKQIKVAEENIRNIGIIADYCASHNMTLLVRTEIWRLPENVVDLASRLKNLNKPNLKFAPSTAILLNYNISDAHLNFLTRFPIKLVVADISKDAFGQTESITYPIYKNKNPKLIEILNKFKNSEIIFDAIFENKDEEYLDSKFYSEITK